MPLSRVNSLKGHAAPMGGSLFLLLMLLIIGGAITRSAIATRWDGFTYDEPWHIAAGVSYVRTGDFRLNPEHPPLVKLWVGTFLRAAWFHMDPLRTFVDKTDERDFVEQEVYLHNDPDRVQRRARVAMWTLNGLLLAVLCYAVRRSFGPVASLGTLLFLAIDPTVAAHLPVVMTDLPVSLLVGSAVALSTRAFRRWAWSDIAMCAALLGLALATKHSAPVFLLLVLAAGFVCALTRPLAASRDSGGQRFIKLLVTGAGALLILWCVYGFRFAESSTGREVFNRPLQAKIADVQSPLYRGVLQGISALHLAPRPYIWGFADTISAGLVGHARPVTAFGRAYWKTAPPYYFPGVLAVKLPIGLSLLVLTGLYLLCARRLPAGCAHGALLILAVCSGFLLVLASGVSYAGVRHALPAVVLLSVIAGFAVHASTASKHLALRALIAVSLVAAGISAIPVMRPWEYFNEFIGGTKNGFLYFNDEGVDLAQRGKELAAYYHRVLEPHGERPYIAYMSDPPEMKARGLPVPGTDGNSAVDPASPTFSGAILIDATFLSKRPFWDMTGLRATTPTARFGNLLVFRGPCRCGNLVAPAIFFSAISMIYSEKPDLLAAEKTIKQSIALDPTPYFVYIQLGNLYLKRGLREDALRSYGDALRYATYDPDEQRLIAAQIRRVSLQPRLDSIHELRDPTME